MRINSTPLSLHTITLGTPGSGELVDTELFGSACVTPPVSKSLSPSMSSPPSLWMRVLSLPHGVRTCACSRSCAHEMRKKVLTADHANLRCSASSSGWKDGGKKRTRLEVKKIILGENKMVTLKSVHCTF